MNLDLQVKYKLKPIASVCVLKWNKSCLGIAFLQGSLDSLNNTDIYVCDKGTVTESLENVIRE